MKCRVGIVHRIDYCDTRGCGAIHMTQHTGRLRDTVPVRGGLYVNGDAVLADVCGASEGWCTGL